MAIGPLVLTRERLFSDADLEALETAAVRMLDEVGFAVQDPALLDRIAAAGFRTTGGRVLIPDRETREFLAGVRAENGDRFSSEPAPPDVSQAEIRLSPSPYPQHVHDPETDRVVPFTTERLIEAAKLCDALRSRRLTARAPGCPSDQPPALQPVVQYWVSATWCREGLGPVDAKSAATMPFVMEMADALDRPVRQLPVYVFSPLALGGESLRCVLMFRDRLSSVGLSNMLSMGCTAPIHAGDAFAAAAAEVVGGAILVGELTGLPVSWSIRLCPADLVHLSMVLGSPEDILLQLAGAEVNAFLHGTRWWPALGSVHTSAKLPGAQACAEKACQMTAGALLGARGFSVAGTLSLDEVFSPEQLLYDLEVRDHVQRVAAGLDTTCDVERCLRDVADALPTRTFVGLPSTAREYRSQYWHPALFERRFLSAWLEGSRKDTRQEARRAVRQLVADHDYALTGDRKREIDRILEAARRALAD